LGGGGCNHSRPERVDLMFRGKKKTGLKNGPGGQKNEGQLPRSSRCVKGTGKWFLGKNVGEGGGGTNEKKKSHPKRKGILGRQNPGKRRGIPPGGGGGPLPPAVGKGEQLPKKLDSLPPPRVGGSPHPKRKHPAKKKLWDGNWFPHGRPKTGDPFGRVFGPVKGGKNGEGGAADPQGGDFAEWARRTPLKKIEKGKNWGKVDPPLNNQLNPTQGTGMRRQGGTKKGELNRCKMKFVPFQEAKFCTRGGGGAPVFFWQKRDFTFGVPQKRNKRGPWERLKYRPVLGGKRSCGS